MAKPAMSSPQKTQGLELDEQMVKQPQLSATSSVASWVADPLKMRVLLTSWFSVTIEFFDFLLFGKWAFLLPAYRLCVYGGGAMNLKL